MSNRARSLIVILTIFTVIICGQTSPLQAQGGKSNARNLYDDFQGSSLNLDKWNPGGANYEYSIDNHALLVNISWFMTMNIKASQSMRAVSAQLTMEQPDTGNAGIDIIVSGSHTYAIAINHCGYIGISEIVPDNNWINTKVINLPETSCPSTHMLGVSVEGKKADFYLDGKKIDTRPWTGYITDALIGGWADTTFQTDPNLPPNTSDPNFKPTIGRVSGAWVDFVH